MRTAFLISACMILGTTSAQLEVDKPIRLTGADGERIVQGVADPSSDSVVVNVSVLSSGRVHWGVATNSGDTVLISVEPTISELRDGLLLRFLPTANNPGRVWIKCTADGSFELRRHDGLPLYPGSLRSGEVAEVLFAGNAWVLINGSSSVCPPGSLPINARSCMDVAPRTGLIFYDALSYCTERGGKLCTWDEYAVGCTVLGTQLTNMFNEWEWLDDCSNHTHTADQAGRFTCQSQRTLSTITLTPANARCCYHPR